MPLRRGPGLVRTMGRTAVVVGTATAVSGRVANRQAQKNAPAEPQQVQYVEAPPAAPSEDDQLAQLEKLGDLHDKGILTDEEFAAKKAQILGI
jgi:Short C-terminal domain